MTRTRARWGGVLVLAALSLPLVQSGASMDALRPDWERIAPGLDRMTVDVAGRGEGWNTRIVALRLDPAAFRFSLRSRMADGAPAWSVDRAPPTSLVAVNAGQFTREGPWGWVVTGGTELRAPARGPLSNAIAWDARGRLRWLEANEIEAQRASGHIVEAFQSYPTLLDSSGEIPPAIRIEGLGVDVGHRDSRLAIGRLADGRLLLAITRFHALGALSPPVPLGLTLAEMAAVMRGLGCRRALALDGGVSAQLMVRDNGDRIVWRGWRKVPLGLVAVPVREE